MPQLNDEIEERIEALTRALTESFTRFTIACSNFNAKVGLKSLENFGTSETYKNNMLQQFFLQNKSFKIIQELNYKNSFYHFIFRIKIRRYA